MVTKTKTRAAAAGDRTSAQIISQSKSLRAWLELNDARLHFRELAAAAAFDEAVEQIGQMPFDWFIQVVSDCCKFFLQSPRFYRRSDSTSWTNAEWDSLQEVCRLHRRHMERLPLMQCELVARTQMKTSWRQLLGLPKSFHVWTDAKSPATPEE